MNSPINWIGGKKQLTSQILRHFPENYKTYVEPFFGAGWVYFRKEPSYPEILNDLNQSLITFWKVMQNLEKVKEFKRRLENVPISEQLFYEFRDKTNYKDDIDQACCFYYVLKLCFGGRGIGTGTENFATETTMKKYMSFFRTDWEALWRRMHRSVILNRDAVEVITTYDREHTFFYLDPPYLVTQETDGYYKFQDSFLHQRLLNVLKHISGKFLLSYDAVPEIAVMYDWAHIIELKTKYTLSRVDERRERTEYLIANFELEKSGKLEGWFK